MFAIILGIGNDGSTNAPIGVGYNIMAIFILALFMAH
jgi:hypothetical protein